MNWPKAIANECAIAFRMTFSDPLKQRPIPKRDSGWFKDPHLRTGFFLSLPFFFANAAISMNSKQPQPVLLTTFSALSVLVWFGYAAWSRERAHQSGV